MSLSSTPGLLHLSSQASPCSQREGSPLVCSEGVCSVLQGARCDGGALMSFASGAASGVSKARLLPFGASSQW